MFNYYLLSYNLHLFVIELKIKLNREEVGNRGTRVFYTFFFILQYSTDFHEWYRKGSERPY